VADIVVRNPQRSRVTIVNSTAYPSRTCENYPVGRWYQQTPNKKIEEATTVLTGGRNEKKRKEFWLRGVDLNHRPLGYEHFGDR
jgi:hypothetical protein